MNTMFKTQNLINHNKSYLLEACIPFLLATIFFAPYVFDKSPQFKFFGDLAILYFPQFLHGFHLAGNGAYSGIDFLTSNGATSYFLRPNIPIYYPINQAMYVFQFISSVEGVARLFVFSLYIQAILCIFFTLKIGRKYLKLGLTSSALFSVIYFGGFASLALTATTFYYIAVLFPLVIYTTLECASINSLKNTINLTASYLLIILAGYAPLAIFAIILAIFFSCYYLIFYKKIEIILTLRNILIPLIWPFLILLPLLITIYFHFKLVSGTPHDLWMTAHQFSFEVREIFSIVSRSVVPSNPGVGTPFVRLGILTLAILILFVSIFSRIKIEKFDKLIIIFSFVIFQFLFILSFGRNTGLPDIFFYLLPIVGGMHYYGRYLIFGLFFYSITVAITYKYIISELDLFNNKFLVLTVGILLFMMVFISQIFSFDWINLKLLAFEIFIVFLFILTLLSRNKIFISLNAIFLILILCLSNIFSLTNNFGIASPGPYKNDVAFSTERTDLLLKYLKLNSDKDLVKYIDITPGIEKPNGLIANFPWFVSEKLKVSNYSGYEPHLSIDTDYFKYHTYPYYGNPNLKLAVNTGADFIVFNDISLSIFSKEISDFIDSTVPPLDLWYGYKVAKLKRIYIGDDPNHVLFDNGFVRALGSSGSQNPITDFNSDYLNYFSFNSNSSTPVKLIFGVFPNKDLNIYIDEKKYSTVSDNGINYIEIPPGDHVIMCNYSNNYLKAFLLFYILFFTYFAIFYLARLFLLVKNKIYNIC